MAKVITYLYTEKMCPALYREPGFLFMQALSRKAGQCD